MKTRTEYRFWHSSSPHDSWIESRWSDPINNLPDMLNRASEWEKKGYIVRYQSREVTDWEEWTR